MKRFFRWFCFAFGWLCDKLSDAIDFVVSRLLTFVAEKIYGFKIGQRYCPRWRPTAVVVIKRISDGIHFITVYADEMHLIELVVEHRNSVLEQEYKGFFDFWLNTDKV